MKSLVVGSQIALHRGVNSMNVTELSSKPISKCFFKLYCVWKKHKLCLH